MIWFFPISVACTLQVGVKPDIFANSNKWQEEPLEIHLHTHLQGADEVCRDVMVAGHCHMLAIEVLLTCMWLVLFVQIVPRFCFCFFFLFFRVWFLLFLVQWNLYSLIYQIISQFCLCWLESLVWSSQELWRWMCFCWLFNLIELD